MYLRYIKIITLLLAYFLCGRVYAFNGPHNLSESPCSVCHIPHHAADDLLWAKSTTNEFKGVKKLCATCHGTGAYGAKDRFGIFSSSQIDETMDHVMGSDASVTGKSVIRTDWSQFPLREKEGGDGFYCGSCHNPHQDPYEPSDADGGGDYLREEILGTLLDSKNKKFKFCSQCHEDLVNGDAFGHGSKDACFDCHHPHNSPNPGSKILITLNQSFKAIPNVPGFSDNGESAATCYGCHKAGGEGPGAKNAPIAGDDCSEPYEHHPMGTGADISISGHQKTASGQSTERGQLLCASCHTVHNGTNDRYLNNALISKYDPKNSSTFCIACHSDKDSKYLGKKGTNHNQEGTYNQCLFCHSIHNSRNDPQITYQTDDDKATEDNSSAGVDVIMRVPPVNLKWADKNLDFDNHDYEDTCYGCHNDPAIVGPRGYMATSTDSDFNDNIVKLHESFDSQNILLFDNDALLLDNVENGYFSHRFDVEASDAIKELTPFDDDLPVVSDGKEKKVLDDYGVEKGHIWCGSCHDVHRQGQYLPYYSEEYKEERTAYLREENISSELCKKCHFKYEGHPSNHPMDKGPNDRLNNFPTNESFPELFYSGYSGGIGGQTSKDGEIICQTCHSVHTALTSWNGYNRDKRPHSGYLLVIDNNYIKGMNQGSGLCLTCHKSGQ